MQRYTVPLFLSLVCHVALFLPFLFLYLTPPTVRPATPGFGGSTVSLSIASLPRERPAPSGDTPEWIQADVQPTLVPTRNANAAPLPAFPAGPDPGGPGGQGTVGPPGSTVLPVATRIQRVVYLIDCSESMFAAWPRARRELGLSLRALPRETLFQVFAYNRTVTPLLLAPAGLARADEVVIEQTLTALGELRPGGSTNHVAALKRGLALRPQVLFLVTDADDLREADVDLVARANQGTVVHVVELSHRGDERGTPLARYARATGGWHRSVRP